MQLKSWCQFLAKCFVKMLNFTHKNFVTAIRIRFGYSSDRISQDYKNRGACGYIPDHRNWLSEFDETLYAVSLMGGHAHSAMSVPLSEFWGTYCPSNDNGFHTTNTCIDKAHHRGASIRFTDDLVLNCSITTVQIINTWIEVSYFPTSDEVPLSSEDVVF
jgi:hypothetical protein